jgi:hypothetical protein
MILADIERDWGCSLWSVAIRRTPSRLKKSSQYRQIIGLKYESERAPGENSMKLVWKIRIQHAGRH